MIDLLIKFPDRQDAIDYGVAWGTTDPQSEETATYFPPGINIHVIGVHSYDDGTGTEEEPHMTTVDGWWVMIRSTGETEIPAELEPLIVERNPSNPAIPRRVWA